MLRSFIKITLRNLAKDRFNSFLNIVGLVIGFTSFAIIILYANHELNYDRFHENADDTYRITTSFTRDGQDVKWAITNGYLAPLLEEQVPEVKTAVKLFITQSNYVFIVGEKVFTVPERTGFFVDPDFFEVLALLPSFFLPAPSFLLLLFVIFIFGHPGFCSVAPGFT